MSARKLCASCAAALLQSTHERVERDYVFSYYARPGVCEGCKRTAMVCYAEGPVFVGVPT